MELFRVFGTVALEGAQAVTQGIQGITEQGSALNQRVGEMGRSVGAAGRSMSTWVTGPIVGATTALFAMGVSLANTVDGIYDTAAATGQSTDAIQTWRVATELAGTSSDAMERAALRLNMQMENIKEGTGPAAEAIERLGINAAQFANMDTDQQLDRIVRALQDVEDPVERARIGTELFGRMWADIAPVVALGAEGLETAARRAARSNISPEQMANIEEFRQNWVELKQELSIAGREIMISLMPALQQLAEAAIQHLVPALQDAVGVVVSMIDGFNNLPSSVQGMIGGFVAFVAVLGPVLVVLGSVMKAMAAFRLVAVVVTAAKLAWAAATLALAGGLAVLLSPVALVIAAIVALGAAIYAGYLLWQNYSEEITDFVSRAVSAIVSFVGDVLGWFADLAVGVWDYVSEMGRNVLSALWEFLSNAVGAIGDFVSNALSAIGSFVSQAVDYFANLGTMVWNHVRNMGRRVVDGIRNMVRDALGSLRDLYNQAVGNSIIPDLVQGVTREFEDMADNAISETQRLRDGVLGDLPADGIEVNQATQTRGPDQREGDAWDGLSSIYDRARANSTIPELVKSVLRDFNEMADGVIGETLRMRQSIFGDIGLDGDQSSLRRSPIDREVIDQRGGGGGPGGQNRGGSGGGGEGTRPVVYDFRHATIYDDHEMLQRFRNSGGAMQGGFN